MLRTMNKMNDGGHIFVVCIGDSITEQNYHLHGTLNYVGRLGERLMERSQRRSRVFNAGVSGDTSWGVLARLERDALRFQPDLVTIMVGMNDSQRGPDSIPEFRRNLEAIVARIAAAGGEALLLTQNMLDYNVREPSVLARESYPAYVAAIVETAAATSTPLVDLCRRWSDRVAGATGAHLMLMHDGIHPNARGHEFIASQLCEYMGIAD